MSAEGTAQPQGHGAGHLGRDAWAPVWTTGREKSLTEKVASETSRTPVFGVCKPWGWFCTHTRCRFWSWSGSEIPQVWGTCGGCEDTPRPGPSAAAFPEGRFGAGECPGAAARRPQPPGLTGVRPPALLPCSLLPRPGPLHCCRPPTGFRPRSQRHLMAGSGSVGLIFNASWTL